MRKVNRTRASAPATSVTRGRGSTPWIGSHCVGPVLPLVAAPAAPGLHPGADASALDAALGTLQDDEVPVAPDGGFQGRHCHSVRSAVAQCLRPLLGCGASPA